ncbi:MAG: hypothetical protein V1897_03135 [Pseudomonadota bacterium]
MAHSLTWDGNHAAGRHGSYEVKSGDNGLYQLHYQNHKSKERTPIGDDLTPDTDKVWPFDSPHEAKLAARFHNKIHPMLVSTQSYHPKEDMAIVGERDKLPVYNSANTSRAGDAFTMARAKMGVKKSMKGTQIIASQGRPSNSRSWPDSTPTEYGEGDAQDHIRDDGTDYIGKSFEQHAAGYPVIIDGIDSSDMLHEVVKSISDTFEIFESSMNNQIDRAFDEAIEFDQGLGKSVLAIGQGVVDLGDRVAQLDDSVTKSGFQGFVPDQQQVQYVQKSGLMSDNGAPNRQEILDAMVKAVEVGEMDQLEVLKFESTGILSSHVQKSLGLH